MNSNKSLRLLELETEISDNNHNPPYFKWDMEHTYINRHLAKGVNQD